MSTDTLNFIDASQLTGIVKEERPSSKIRKLLMRIPIGQAIALVDLAKVVQQDLNVTHQHAYSRIHQVLTTRYMQKLGFEKMVGANGYVYVARKVPLDFPIAS